MWEGIEVWGDTSKYQLNAVNYQGMVKLMNYATIENAKTAIVTIKRDGSTNYYNYAGGIVNCTNATILNCPKGVIFYKYENRNPLNNKPINNISAFTECNFIINPYYLSTDSVGNQVELSQVRGILFKGCSFNNLINNNLGSKATGIFSYNSSFSVLPTCSPVPGPCIIAVRSSFTGLRYGIRALGAATTKTFQVQSADFNSNTCGLFANAIDFTNIIQNTFNVLPRDTNINFSNATGGLYLEQCKFYTIEENIFNCVIGLHPDKYVGLTISNSGSDNNQVYKNTFNNLDIGILAQGKNKNPANFAQGLCIRCNNFNNTIYDVAVTKPMNGSNDQNGIARYQGSVAYPAGNLFTNTDTYTYPTYCNYYNLQSVLFSTESPYVITYYHHIKTQQYNTIPNLRRNVTISNTQKDFGPDTCASHLNGGNSNLIGKIAQNDNFANAKESELAALVDGGETFEMVNEVVYSYPDEALELHEQLLQQSPYLSDTLMKSAIEKENVLNNAMVRDVLVANPQSAKSAELMQKLDERIEPMPDYMKEEIEEGATTVSPKEQLEADILMGKAEAEGWYNRMIGVQLFDTTGNSASELNNILELRPRVSNDYFKAVANFESGQNQTGLNTLEAIPAQYDLNSQQMLDHNKLLEAYQLLSAANMNTKPVQLIDATQINAFNNHINDLGSLGDNYLRNTLIASGNFNSTEQYILPDLSKSTDVENTPKKKNKKPNEFLKVFPNPAKEYIIIEYINGKAENNFILISDGMGRTVDNIPINKRADQVLYITKNLKPGLYNCSFSHDGRKSSVKFTVIR
jgi:hypothetical protein